MKRIKVALDANVPPRLVRMLESGYSGQGFEFLWVPDLVPANTEDEYWAGAFRRFGGQIVVSGDKNIAKKPHQISAFKENDLICFFCDKKWSEQDNTYKASHLIYWWPQIQLKFEESSPKDCWWVPMGIREQPFKPVKVPDHVLKTSRAKKSV